MLKILTLIIALAVAVPALAQRNALDSVRHELIGDRSRTWSLTEITFFKGVRKACKQGEIYTFSSRGVVEVTVCASGRLSTSRFNWSLYQETPLDVMLSFGGKQYYVSFSGSGRDRVLRLRDLADRKLNSTTDIKLRLARADR